jgi:molybdopterin synthase sulfur carrier subunit
MAHVVFTSHITRHVRVPDCDVEGGTLREALEKVFAQHGAVRGYVVDDQGHLRKHVTVFVDGQRVRDREGLSDPVAPQSEIHVFQALTGG